MFKEKYAHVDSINIDSFICHLYLKGLLLYLSEIINPVIPLSRHRWGSIHGRQNRGDDTSFKTIKSHIFVISNYCYNAIIHTQ